MSVHLGRLPLWGSGGVNQIRTFAQREEGGPQKSDILLTHADGEGGPQEADTKGYFG